VIYARTHGVPTLATSWAQLPVGSLLRRDPEPRIYANLFTKGKGDIGGWRRAYVLSRAKRLPEPDNLAESLPVAEGLNLVVFSGLGQHFRTLQGWNELIRQELVSITRQFWRQRAETVATPFVGVHVRRGDFNEGIVTPLDWFVRTLSKIRAQLSLSVSAVVTSDGSAAELDALLAMDDVRLVSTGSAIGDLLLLSRSSLLLASGSSFSAWASYLGQMPTLTHPGQSLARLFQLKGAPGQIIAEFDPCDHAPLPLPANFALRPSGSLLPSDKSVS
jgi:hypothetical protein